MADHNRIPPDEAEDFPQACYRTLWDRWNNQVEVEERLIDAGLRTGWTRGGNTISAIERGPTSTSLPTQTPLWDIGPEVCIPSVSDPVYGPTGFSEATQTPPWGGPPRRIAWRSPDASDDGGSPDYRIEAGDVMHLFPPPSMRPSLIPWNINPSPPPLQQPVGRGLAVLMPPRYDRPLPPGLGRRGRTPPDRLPLPRPGRPYHPGN
jgi:hypothetical protein